MMNDSKIARINELYKIKSRLAIKKDHTEAEREEQAIF